MTSERAEECVLETTIAEALRSKSFENFDRRYGLSGVIAAAILALPVEQRMDAMGMTEFGRIPATNEGVVTPAIEAWAEGAPVFMEAKWTD